MTMLFPKRRPTLAALPLALCAAMGAAHAAGEDPAGAKIRPAQGANELRAGQAERGSTFVIGTGERISFEKIDGLAVFEGDIVLGRADLVERRGVNLDLRSLKKGERAESSVIVSGVGYRWPSATVPYAIDAGVSTTVRDHISQAVAHWQEKTNLRFVARTTQSNYIRFVVDSGQCYTYAGMQGGAQEVHLDNGGGCGFGGTVHEIGHDIGFLHEQTRNDRDSNITIHWSNIKTDWHSQFEIRSGTEDNGTYDYDSIMHYPAYAGSGVAIDPSKPIMTPVDSSVSPSRLGQRSGLSAGDIASANAMYLAPPQTVLKNGVPVTGLAGAAGAELRYTLSVPAGATNLNFQTSGGTGDADMYVKFGTAPTTGSYDCRPYADGNNESCPVAPAKTGTYHVMLRGYQAFSGVSLVGSYSTGGLFENLTDYSIPDNNATGIKSPISVSRTGDAGSVEVKVDIKHAYRGDLEIDLIRPDGVAVRLKSASNDSAANLLATYTVNAGGVASNGVWQLHVKDKYAQDVGYIDAWSVKFP